MILPHSVRVEMIPYRFNDEIRRTLLGDSVVYTSINSPYLWTWQLLQQYRLSHSLSF